MEMVEAVSEYADMDIGGILPGEGEGIVPPAFGDRKIVTTFRINAETKDFDTSVNFVRSIVHELGGYVETSSEQGRSLNQFDKGARWAEFTLRVPARSIHQFVAIVGDNYNVTNLSERSEDITDSYFDSAARLASLENHERLLHELLERDGDLEHIMLVYSEIANVRWQIERINSSLQLMDSAVNFSTVHLSLQEVMEFNVVDPMPLSFGERIGQAWSGAWNDFVRYMQNSTTRTIRNLPWMIMNFLEFLFWVAVFLIVRRVIRKRKGKKKGEATFEWLTLPKSWKRPRKATPPDDGGGDNGDA
jgi:hypothetical protein